MDQNANIESYRDDRGLQITVTIVDCLPKFDNSRPMNKVYCALNYVLV